MKIEDKMGELRTISKINYATIPIAYFGVIRKRALLLWNITIFFLSAYLAEGYSRF